MILYYLTVSVMPLVQHPLWSAFVGELTVIKIVGALSLVYGVLYLRARRSPPHFFETPQAKLFVLLMLIVMTSFVTIGGPQPFETSPFVNALSLLLFFFLTIMLVDSVERLRWVLLTSIGSVSFASLYVLREWQKAPWRRPGWVTGDPNYFTVSALLCLPLAFYLAMDERRPRWERIFCWVSIVVTLVAVSAAGSRGGSLGLLAGLAFIIWRGRRRLRNILLMSIVVTPMLFVVPGSPVMRWMNPNHGDISSVELRTDLVEAGLHMIRANPVFGIGVGNFKPESVRYGAAIPKIAHNTYLQIAAEAGIGSLLLFLAIFALTVRTLEQVRRTTLADGAPLLHQAAVGLQGGLFGTAVGLMFFSGEYHRQFWLEIFIAMCLPALVRDTRPPQPPNEPRRAGAIRPVRRRKPALPLP